MSEKNYGFETLALHAGQPLDTDTRSRAVPVYRTTSYVFKDSEHAANLFALKELGHIYSRIMNPTQEILENRLAALEKGATALALSSGTSGIFYSLINVCKTGDEVVASRNLYGGTYTMLSTILPNQFGIKVHFADPDKPETFKKLINEKTRAIYIESVSNPTLSIPDFEAFAKIAQDAHLPLMVDSTFATPYLLNPIDYGANVVIHSLTKWIGGHGTAVGGVVVDAGNFDWTEPKFALFNEPDPSYHGLRYAHDLGDLNPVAFALRMRLVSLRNLGACITPDNAWMFLQGLETLPLRMERHSENALKVAQFLESHPQVEWVRYPGLKNDPAHATASKYFKNGFGGMVIFGIKGGKERGQKFIENLELFSHLANVGDAKSLAIHPASTTHSQLSEDELTNSNITPELVRLSIGIEKADDIIADLEQSLKG